MLIAAAGGWNGACAGVHVPDGVRAVHVPPAQPARAAARDGAVRRPARAHRADAAAHNGGGGGVRHAAAVGLVSGALASGLRSAPRRVQCDVHATQGHRHAGSTDLTVTKSFFGIDMKP